MDRQYDELTSRGTKDGNRHLLQGAAAFPAPTIASLADFDGQHISAVMNAVPGGLSNVKALYPLSPLQEGMHFHHVLSGQRDTYILSALFQLKSRSLVAGLTAAIQKVIARHDALRTCILWEGLPRPVQVVLHQVSLPIGELLLDPHQDALEQIKDKMQPGHESFDVRQAPMVRLVTAQDPHTQQCYALLQVHHLICDHLSLGILVSESLAYANDNECELPPAGQYRDYVARELTRLDTNGSELFFRSKLADVTEPTAPFGFLDVHGEDHRIEEAQLDLGPALTQQLRARVERLKVSAARLFHCAWAMVVARTSDREDVVFGTIFLTSQERGTTRKTVGLSINTLPLRLKLANVTVEELVQQTHQELLQLRQHDHTPLTAAQRCSGITGTAPLFSSLFNFRHSARGASSHSAEPAGVRVIGRGEAWTNYPITVLVDDLADTFVVTAQTHPSIDPQRVAGYLQAAMKSLLQALETAPQTRALSLPVLPQDEQQQIVQTFNATHVAGTQHRLIHQLIEAQVARTPQALAASFDGVSLTYAELNSRANQLARYLKEKDIGPDQLVGLCVERNLDMLVGLLGILKAGGAYIPLDPAYPADRLQHMLDDAQPRVLLTQSHLQAGLPASVAEVVALDGDWNLISQRATDNLAVPASNTPARQLAYIIYTSGSTGKPKGVMVEHAGVTNFLLSMQRTLGVQADDVVLAVTTISFDIAGLELYLPLITGAKVVLASRTVAADAALLAKSLDEQQITVLQATPATWQLLLSGGWAGRPTMTALCGGEALTSALCDKLLPRVGALWNLYGPTETTIWSTAHAITGPSGRTGSVESIGSPIANTQIYILDRSHAVMPMGVAGEIYIGGGGVARGYLNRPELTQERFIPDPFSADPQARLYKTGDLGRWRSDGTIEYLGRNDHQIKIRGFRIELGEIEAQLLHHPQVKQAAVVAREDLPGDKRLVAYLVARLDEAQAAPSVDSLRAQLKTALPEYMVPSAFVVLEAMPLTPNGKLDRRALPAPDLGAYSSRQYAAPQGEVEEILAGIWQALLKVERVGRRDNFFELGGHSLLIVQMLERLRRVGLAVEVRRVFESPSLADLASSLSQAAIEHFAVPPNLIPADCEQITPQMLPLVELQPEHIEQIVRAVPGGATNIQDIYPLTPLQEGLLFHHLLNQHSADIYARSMLLSLPSLETAEALITALQTLIGRHDVLRTAILWEELPQAVQVVHRQVTLPVQRLTLEESSDPLEQLDSLTKAERSRTNLRRAPLMHLQLALSPRDNRWYALLHTHHLVCDNESLGVLFAELRACLEHRDDELLPATAYRDHVAHAIAYFKAHDAESFFRHKLADVDEPTLPFGLADVHGDGARTEETRQSLPQQLAKRIREQARRLAVSSATLFHAAWSLVTAHASGRDDVVFGSVLLGRLQGSTGSQGTLGMFINTLPLRIRLQQASVRDLVESVQKELVDLLTHEQASLSVAQRCTAVHREVPLFNSLLNYRHTRVSPSEDLPESGGVQLISINGSTNYPIVLSVDDLGEGFSLEAKTDQRLAPQRVTAYVLAALESLVTSLEQAPTTDALSLSVLPEEERHQVLKAFNSTTVPYPATKLIHEIFEAQARKSPDVPAVVSESHSLTYAELNCRANQAARHLRQLGVGPDTLVGICVERSVEMIVAILATLKAGGAYVPLDPNYPADRMQYLLSDAAPQAVLTQEHLRSRLPATAATVVALDTDWASIDRHSATDLEFTDFGLRSNHLAYLIYTSGSTGAPKGVMVEHRNVVKLWQSLEYVYRELESPCRIAVNASINFDSSVKQLVQLLSGSTLYPVPEKIRWDAGQLLAFAQQNRLTGIDCTPSQLKSWLAADLFSLPLPALRVVLVGGEAIDIDLWQHLARSEQILFYNVYGPTECTVDATLTCLRLEAEAPHIGRPMENTQIYLLDGRKEPVPMGVAGEIYIGGGGVARGYLNRPELTQERFIPDPFSADPRARLYKTGDLGRWRPDGTIEYLGRNDHQIKIRGFRIELGEIEAQLLHHPQIKQAAVIAREDLPGDRRLVAYLVARGDDAQAAAPSVDSLRAQLKAALPEYMVPSAFVVLEQLPLTPNGKLDRRALPAPQLAAYSSREYEAPQGEVEEILAGIWQALLKVERVGRRDNFFELGGHSLLIVQMLERLRRVGFSAEIRSVFESPSLADLASSLTRGVIEHFAVPPNLIPADCEQITPEMLPLVELQPEHIEQIVRAVPGGVTNIQDIYPLAPLQEGLLFHHLMHERGGDPYVAPTVLSVASRDRLEELIAGLQGTIDRHDVMRTAILWDGLPQPLQVVYRRAVLPVKEIRVDGGRDIQSQIRVWLEPERQRLDLRQAPMIRVEIAADPVTTEWYVLVQLHHILGDNTSRDILLSEVMDHLNGHTQVLPASIPYRDHVAQALAHAKKHDSEAFFRDKLGDIEEPSAPFGLLDVHGDGSHMEEARSALDYALSQRVRKQARSLGISAATLFHAAWALVIAATTGRPDVVFGSVLLGRLQGTAGAQRILGLFINTLPLRLKLDGTSVKGLVEQTQRELVQLLSHEQTSLAVAQRCTALPASTPIFSALLNYRSKASDSRIHWADAEGVQVHASRAYTNYPITLSIDEDDDQFVLTALTDDRIDPSRITEYLRTTVQSLVEALETAPGSAALTLSVLPETERRQVLETFNSTQANIREGLLVHELVEEQARRSPAAIAVTDGGQSLTYADLNNKANQLARYLIAHDLRPDQVVGICVERSLGMVIGLLAVLKAGGAYLPLDPAYPPERLRHMLDDASPRLVLTQTKLQALLSGSQAKLIDIDGDLGDISRHATANISPNTLGLGPRDLVYVIYTSGSTGRPKGITMPHRSMTNLLEWHRHSVGSCAGQAVLQFAALSFDVAFQEVFSTLTAGGTLVLLEEWVRKDVRALMDLLCDQSISRLFIPPLMLQTLAEYAQTIGTVPEALVDVITAGEQLRISPEITSFFNQLPKCRLHNHYGPTETHVVTSLVLSGEPVDWPAVPTIGQPISNSRIYILNGSHQPAPLGVAGEIYIGGAAVARGYLNRPEMTAERFVRDPFSGDKQGQMYKTGDLARWCSDGTIEYLGRNDHQVKIRGFRVELGEIEAQLAKHPGVKDIAIIPYGASQAEKSLVAYVTPRGDFAPEVSELRSHMKALLPDHMVPGAFVMLERFPLTPNGKLDRNALPKPELAAYTNREQVAPEGPTEVALAEIWRKVLKLEVVGRDDNFFEVGGHSLLALKALLDINHTLGATLRVTDIYANPTIRDLAGRVQGSATTEKLIDLSAEATLSPQVRPIPVALRTPAANLLMTGSTGFVGRFLLAQLLEDTDATIYCMVRADSDEHATSRLQTALSKWDLWRPDYAARLVPMAGDLRLPRLGLSDSNYQAVARHVDAIYHCGTSMNHLETYQMAKAANVDAIRELLQLAVLHRPKLINYVSTMGIFSHSPVSGSRVVAEDSSIDEEKHPHTRGYAGSKWVGEKILLTARERGIPCNIFRLGLVWADTERGRFDDLQHVYRLIKSCLLSGYGIKGYRYELPPTPVDYVARAITYLGTKHTDGRGTFHIAPSIQVIDGVFEFYNQLMGHSLELLPYFDWIGKIKKLHAEGVSLPIVPLIEFAFSLDKESFHEYLRNSRFARISVDCQQTTAELQQAGIPAPVLNEELFRLCLEGMFATDPDLQSLDRDFEDEDRPDGTNSP